MKKTTIAGCCVGLIFAFQSFSEESAKPAPKRRISSYSEGPTFNPPAEVIEKMNDPQQPFNAYWMKNSIGLEGGLPLGAGIGTGNTTILSKPAVAYGMWTSPTTGWEFYFGTNKDGDTGTTTTTEDNPISPSTSKVVTTSYSSAGPSARSFILGAAYKHRLYQVKHFGLSADFLAVLVPGHSSQYINSGTITTTTPNINSPATYSVQEQNIINKDVSYSTAFGFGPRFNVEYNFPYVPNLLIGVSTGVFVRLGGASTETTTTTNQTTNYVNGNAGTPVKSGNHGDSTVIVTNPGVGDGTYGIGGMALNLSGPGLIPLSLVGTFRIRYAF